MELIKLITVTNKSYPVNWAALSHLDGSLRFEVSAGDFAELYRVFTDPAETIPLARVFDASGTGSGGSTDLFRIERMQNGIVIGLRRPA